MNAPIGPLASPQPTTRVRCRPIEERDLPAVVDLLCEGFPERGRPYWVRGLQRLAERAVPADCPRFGQCLDNAGEIVGCLLLIVTEDGAGVRRANVSSWFVRPAFRFQASMLVSMAFRLPRTTFVNISPAPHTLPILVAQGYRSFADGQIVGLPLLSRHGWRQRVSSFTGAGNTDGLSAAECDLLARHAALGCIALLCRDGTAVQPFVFIRTRSVRGVIPSVQLVWCRDIAAVGRCAHAIGRGLLRYGVVATTIDADGPMSGLPGSFRAGRGQRFFRGPVRPRLGDLADTELVLFGP